LSREGLAMSSGNGAEGSGNAALKKNVIRQFFGDFFMRVR
jgi:hypothetical protein